jgi:putative transposase
MVCIKEVIKLVTRRVTFRLYPNNKATKKLLWARRMHKDLYNSAIANRDTQYKKFGRSISYFDQQNSLPALKEELTEYKKLASQSLQGTLKRVDMAYQSFFKGLRGKPKFKSIRHYSGWTYPGQSGWAVYNGGKNGFLNLLDLKLKIRMRGQARTWGYPKTCTIVYRKGKWYASITVNCTPKRETAQGSIGIDFGVNHALAFSNGEKKENPRCQQEASQKIKKASRQLRRKRSPNHKKKVKGSKRWKKARKRVSDIQADVANKRKDWQHKVTTLIVSGNSLVATEKLNIKGMTSKANKASRKKQKTGLNRAILDVGIASMIGMLRYKLEECGGFLIEVPTKKVKPSQTCPYCDHQRKKELSERVHLCSECGYTNDRVMSFTASTTYI